MNPTIPYIAQRSFAIKSLADAKRQVFRWAQSFRVACYLDSNEYGQQSYGGMEAMAAVGVQSEITVKSGAEVDAFQLLKNYYEERPKWLFGYLSYDLKNSIEGLVSENFDGLSLPEMHFFEPVYIIKIYKEKVVILSNKESPEIIWTAIENKKVRYPQLTIDRKDIQARIAKSDYLKTIQKIKHHLHIGDIYEMNFCQEFYLKNIKIRPAALFEKLNDISKAPFSCFYRRQNEFLLSASPERFLKKQGRQLISQPIKGTIGKGHSIDENLVLQQKLSASQKDRTENVMIVDLVRNDLSRSCEAGSVKVEELFKIYPFEQVHHMISTVVGTIRPEVHFVDAIKNAFPMGSMTGAPKIRSMELIEHYEHSKRGLYSGAVGYITPEGDFDFNVVIRSLIYQARRKYLSFQVGGAIVDDSDPEKEYEECLLKVAGILRALEE